MIVDSADEVRAMPLQDRAIAETYVASVCFKHGPPRRIGVELEWTVHHANDPRRRLDAQHLADALGEYAPPTLDPHGPHRLLPGGSAVTVEPGGQVELSSPPFSALSQLIRTVSSDADALANRLADAGLIFGRSALDPYRAPRRVLDTPRYAAMEAGFADRGTDGIAMMCSTAALQVCLDAGEPDRVPTRWAAVHALGPALAALFTNSTHQRAGNRWACARLRTVLGTAPGRMRPAPVTDDPAAGWARHVLDVPVLCVRQPGGCWQPPKPLTFADWIAGALPNPPSVDDLEYHISTMFPPVRPRGYLEVRYLDAQAGDDWLAPLALLVALFADESIVDEALTLAMPSGRRWLHAARYGIADPAIGATARAIVELGCQALQRLPGLDRRTADAVIERLTARVNDTSMARRRS